MTRPARTAPSSRVWVAAGAAAAIGAVTFVIWWGTSPAGPKGPALRTSAGPEGPALRTDVAGLPRGGTLTGSIRANPASFNPYVANGDQADAIAQLTQARLVRINRSTNQPEPWLAESWDASNDNLTYTIKLRPNIVWSDGVPFTSGDVVFSFRAVYDPQSTRSIWSSLLDGEKPLSVLPAGPLAVTITFPAPFAFGLRLLDHLPILPMHLLAASLNDGTFAKAWGPKTTPAEMAGLGPFVLSAYKPGDRLVFARNPHYWRKAPDGKPLPYLDGLVLRIVPDEAAELQQLLGGQLDFTQSEIRVEDFPTLERAEQSGKIRVYDLGPGFDADALWFNLSPGPEGPGLRTSPGPKGPGLRTSAGGGWLKSDDFRLAISAAVNRRAFCNVVFPDGCDPIYGPITPGNVVWFSPDLPAAGPDAAMARTMLAGIGLQDRNGDGILDDNQRHPVRFSLLVQRGLSTAERGAAFLRAELQRVGIDVDVVSLEPGALMDRWRKGDYDAIYGRLATSDTDPAMNLDYWLSSGSSHVWAPGQAKPATDWEHQIDELMLKQAGATDRVQRAQLFADVQKIFAKHMPAIYFGAPYEYVATSTRVLNATPSRQRPPLLWNADILATSPR